MELILGLKPIRKALEDLDNLKKSFDNELKNAIGNDSKLKEFKKEFEEIQRELTEKENKKREIVNLINQKQEKLRQLRAELADSSSQEVKKLEDKRKQLEYKQERLLNDKKHLEKRLDDLSSNLHLLILRSILEDRIKEIEENLKNLEEKKAKFNEIDAHIHMLKKLVSESKCPICGKLTLSSEISEYQRELEELLEHNRNIEKSKKEIENKYARYRTIYLRLNEKLNKIKKWDYNEIFDIRQKIRNINSELNAIKKDLEKLSDNLQTMGIKLVSALEQQISTLSGEISRYKKEKEDLEKIIARMKERKETLRNKIKILSAKGSPVDIINQKIKTVDILKNALEEYLNEIIEKRRNDLIKEATQIFLELTNKKEEYIGFEFSSDNNYRFQIIAKDESKPNMDTISYGELEIVALSFILGLNKYSHMKAPIITDTLFGRLSPYVQENLAKFFKDMDVQLILLVLKDSREGGKTEIDDIAPIFKEKIGNELLIIREQKNRVSTIKETTILGGE